jgi:hypothetical protein
MKNLSLSINKITHQMSEWLICDYYLYGDDTQMEKRRAIPVRAIKYMELDSESNQVQYAVVGKKRYHPENPREAQKLIQRDPSSDMICDAIDSLAKNVEEANEMAQKSASAIVKQIQEVDSSLSSIGREMLDPKDLIEAITKRSKTKE